MSTIAYLTEKKLSTPPKWLPSNVHYETIMGSVAYGVSDSTSDMDVYGFCIPKKEEIFRHLNGEIEGFGKQKQRFEQFQDHGIKDVDALGGYGRTYDLTIFNIVRFFHLALENNPNVIDSLYTPANCVLHITEIGRMVRENRKRFLHKGIYPRLKGYSYAQLNKISNKNNSQGKRKEIIEQYGWDVKFGYHVCRLLLQAEMVLAEEDMDLQRHKEQLKAIRRGEWTEQQLRDWASAKEKSLEELYIKSTLRWGPDEVYIKQLLIDCLEHHFGSLQNCLIQPDAVIVALRNIQGELDKVKNLL